MPRWLSPVERLPRKQQAAGAKPARGSTITQLKPTPKISSTTSEFEENASDVNKTPVGSGSGEIVRNTTRKSEDDYHLKARLKKNIENLSKLRNGGKAITFLDHLYVLNRRNGSSEQICYFFEYVAQHIA